MQELFLNTLFDRPVWVWISTQNLNFHYFPFTLIPWMPCYALLVCFKHIPPFTVRQSQAVASPRQGRVLPTYALFDPDDATERHLEPNLVPVQQDGHAVARQSITAGVAPF